MTNQIDGFIFNLTELSSAQRIFLCEERYQKENICKLSIFERNIFQSKILTEKFDPKVISTPSKTD